MLFVVPSYKDYFDIPGGYVEIGETPSDAVRREVKEEIGIAPPIGRLLVADWWSDSPETRKAMMLLLVFGGGILGRYYVDQIIVDRQEIVATEFAHPDALEEVTISWLANRISCALDARSSSCVIYLENGLRRALESEQSPTGAKNV